MSRLIRYAKKLLESNILTFPQQRYTSSQQPIKDYDLLVVGGGIMGVSTAREMLKRHPFLKIAIVEKESKLATHQSGHAKGIIYTGLLCSPGSLNAKLCIEGYRLACTYIYEKRIPHKKCGKLIVATHRDEIKNLMNLYKNGIENDVPNLTILRNQDEIQKVEPFCRGIKALWSPETCIVNWVKVVDSLAKDFKANSGDIILNFKVRKLTETKGDKAEEYPITVHGCLDNDILHAKNVLTCAGLQSDLLAKKTGCSIEPRPIPFRSEQLQLAKERQHMVKGIIYSVPKTRLSFLVPHFTSRLDESVLYGPSTLLALGREGYKSHDASIIDLFNVLRYPGFMKLVSHNFGLSVEEFRKSVYLSSQVTQFQKLIPELKISDVKRASAGVAAVAVNRDGSLMEEIVLHRSIGNSPLSTKVIHCRSFPSPGATNSLAIAKIIANAIELEFDIGDRWCDSTSYAIL
uniref:L-2-hydroxyglutarate dehydrogenase, mitochondrial n=1 Tax=Glossina brevipalpis TaxID=37001 RepID=A0A1A9WMB8_9MUSC